VMHCHYAPREHSLNLRFASPHYEVRSMRLTFWRWCSPRNRRRSISLEPVQCARPPSTIRIVGAIEEACIHQAHDVQPRAGEKERGRKKRLVHGNKRRIV
jgi:hypothetical protein